MTSQPPPSRYRVVEEGRRLVVIDTRTGESATRGRDALPERVPLGPERIAFDGRAVLVTRPFYDDKGPRRLVLDEGTAAWLENARSLAIGGVVLAVVLTIFIPSLMALFVIGAVALANGRTRATLRSYATSWLDRYETDPT
ncbi:hypothetical protein ACFSC3_19005 [Sphingomonas floccifaciens]|uniref:Uncharacterized protein n=1 Tax=Sphingomonas floccifaciens TaxID=1844115 RepID=A0ABW4NHW2_9SPHN